jgi:site-specific recombinase XerC
VSQIRTMIAELKEQGYAKNTVRLAVASLRTVLGVALEDGLIPKNPASVANLGKRAIVGAEKREAKSMEPEGGSLRRGV